MNGMWNISKGVFALFLSLYTYINVHADVDTTWLVNQQNLDGSFVSVNDLGYPVQNTSEALQTLYALGDISLVNENLGLQIISASDSVHLENIVRKVLANASAAQDTSLLASQLKSFFNVDGGFGSIENYQSTVLDTALAIQTWPASNALLGVEFGYAVGFLTSRQNANGSWSSAGNESSLYVTAMVSLALQKTQSVYAVTDNINSANNYLINAVQNNISNIETFEIAMAIISIAPITPDKTTYQLLRDRLLLMRDVDGSWGQDVYSTALAMRALYFSELGVPVKDSLSSVTQPGSSISAVTGVVKDSFTGQALEGALISISTNDGANASVITGADGSYVIGDLFPGDASITVEFSEYRTVTASPNLVAGVIQRFNPVLAPQPLPVPVNITGNIIDADTSLPLSGVSVQVASSSIGTLSNVSGNFELNDLSPGSISIQITNAGYIGRSYVISAASGGVANLGLVVLTPGTVSSNLATLSGTITDAISGQPLNGVAISLSGADNQAAFTDVNGVFTINKVNSGASDITAILTGYTNAASSINIATGINAQFNAAMVKSDNQTQITVQGIVVDNETLLPLTGVAIEVAGDVVGQEQFVQTNVVGEFQVGGITPGLLKISLSLANYQSVIYNVTAAKGGFVNLGQISLSTNLTTTVPRMVISANVPGISNLWFAGMPDGTTSAGDIAPTHSPVLVNGVSFSGEFLTFENVTGGALNFGGCSIATGIGCDVPDGGTFFNHFPGSINGMSNIRSPINALLGVFLDDNQPDNTPAPAVLNFQTMGTDFVSLAPELKQIFFIGDGLTGKSEGEVQKFTIPDGATRLYLGTMDGNGWFNNSGAINVDIIFEVDVVDLIVTELNVSNVSTNLQTLQVHGVAEVSISNVALAPLDIPTRVTVFEDSNANQLYDLDIDNILGAVTVFAGQVIGVPLDVDVPLSGVVAFRDGPIYAMVDSDEQISESNEVNNVNDTLSLCQADVTASLLEINSGTNQSVDISVRIGNGGVLSIEQPFNINFYEGDPVTNGVLLGKVTLDNLASATFEDVTLNNIPALSGNDNLYVIADINNVIQECSELNNSVSLPVFAGSSVVAVLSVGTNEPQYVTSNAIPLQGNVINNSVLPGQFRVQLQIEDAQGNLIQSFEAHDTNTLAGQDSFNVSDVWNSAGFLTGNYQLRGQLFDLQGELLSTSTHNFNLTSNLDSTPRQVVAAIRVNTDKLNYHTNDRVAIDNLVSNLSSDTVINNALLRITITNADSAAVFTQTVPLSSLTAGSRLQQGVDYSFINETEGDYSVSTQLLTQQGAILASAETSYTVVSDNTQSIAGETNVQVSSVLAGQAQICTDKILNTGNQNFTSLSIQQVVIDVNTQQTLQAQTQSIDLNTGDEQTLIRNINTASLSQGDYICALQASIDGNLYTLGFAAFTVIETPVNVDGALTLGSRGQLLVWLGEQKHRHPHDENHHAADQHHGYHYGSRESQHSHSDNQNEQRQFLETLLNDGGWNYTLVDNRNDFITEFSSGRYQAYLLLNGKKRLGKRLGKALREAVNRGEGLVTFARNFYHSNHQGGWFTHHNRHNPLAEVLGIRQHQHRVRSQSINFTNNNPLNLQGSIDFSIEKYAHSVVLKQAQEIMRYTLIEDEYCHAYNYNGSQHSGHALHDTAVSFNQYGKGRAIYAGFDVLAYATQYQDKTLLTDLINRALEETHPIELALLTSMVVPIDLTIFNSGSSANVRATLTAPINATWLRASEGDIADTQAIWQYLSPADSEREFTAWLQLPPNGGDIPITLLVEAGIDENNFIAQENLSINLSVSMDVMLSDIINQIQDLQAQGYHQAFLNKALKKLKRARKFEQKNRLSLATTFALAATDKLKNKTDQAIIEIRLQVDNWLRMATLRDGGRWCRYMENGD